MRKFNWRFVGFLESSHEMVSLNVTAQSPGEVLRKVAEEQRIDGGKFIKLIIYRRDEVGDE